MNCAHETLSRECLSCVLRELDEAYATRNLLQADFEKADGQLRQIKKALPVQCLCDKTDDVADLTLKCLELSRQCYDKAEATIKTLRAGGCACWQEKGATEKAHGTHCPEQSADLLKLFSQRVRELRWALKPFAENAEWASAGKDDPCTDHGGGPACKHAHRACGTGCDMGAAGPGVDGSHDPECPHEIARKIYHAHVIAKPETDEVPRQLEIGVLEAAVVQVRALFMDPPDVDLQRAATQGLIDAVGKYRREAPHR